MHWRTCELALAQPDDFVGAFLAGTARTLELLRGQPEDIWAVASSWQ